jgi:ribosomal protein S18 acetylase RimI-like enzyme
MNSLPPASGPRRARFPQDVPQITELVELCFQDVMDYSSRRMLRDVRWIAQMGDAAWGIARLLRSVNPAEWLANLVWEEQGRIVGNVTLTRRAPEEDAWLISNVAVHPDYRHRSIARVLVSHALEEIRRRGGRKAYLQVDEANESAVRVYRGLGFEEISRRLAWFRSYAENPHPPSDPGSVPGFRVAIRAASEWSEEFALWRDVSPHGVAWNAPLTEQSFRPSFWKRMEQALDGEAERHFLARREERVEAALSAFTRPSGWEGVLIQRPETGGKVEEGLLAAAWKVFPAEHNVLLETTPQARDSTLTELGFRKRRTFIWMRYTFDGGAP